MNWQKQIYTGGRMQDIAALLADGSHKVEAWGNKEDGWAPYLVSTACPFAGIQIGPIFIPYLGDRLKDLRYAAARAYGVEAKAVKKGRSFP